MKRTRAESSLTSSSPTYNPWKMGGLSFSELGRRLWHESLRSDILGRAAQLSYYILLALFPALLVLTALMGALSVQSYMPHLMSYLREVLPNDVLAMVERFLKQVAAGSGADILSLGALGALWASSSGVAAIMEALNVVCGVKQDSRPFWRTRLTAIVLTIGLAGFVILSLTLVLYGTRLSAWIADLVGLGWVFVVGWNLLQWPVVAAIMFFVVAVLYSVCPDIKQDWRWVTPGSAIAVAMWFVVSLGFKLYVDHFGDYNKIYGSIAGVIVLMLWLYFSGTVLLLGGQINAEIDKAATSQAHKDREHEEAA